MSTFERALAIAATAHAGQTDKAGEPYILHVMRVVLGVTSNDERTVAALHDVIEDTDWTFERLAKEGFGPDIINAVDAMTHRSHEGYETFVERAGSLPLSCAVKIADLRDNLSMARQASLPDRLRERYAKALRQLGVTDDVPESALSRPLEGDA